jgi:protein Hikeshi
MSQPLFGLVAAGQPVIVTPTETPTPTSFIFAIPSPPSSKSSSHVVVFLLPGVNLPEGSAAAIYLVTPPGPGQAAPNSKFLGGIGRGKESAIFKVGVADGQAGIVLGVSVEPATSVAERMGELSSGKQASEGSLALTVGSQTQQVSTLALAQRIIKNAFNFLASYSGQAGSGGIEVVPLRAFEEWWKKFEGRIRSDPGFLERDG